MRSADISKIAMKPLHAALSGELVLRPTSVGRIDLAVCLGGPHRDGMPMVVLKGLSGYSDLPHPAWWRATTEVLSLGMSWLIEPIGAADSSFDAGRPGLLLRDGTGWKLRLGRGPDNLGPVDMCYDLSERAMRWPFRAAYECYPQWRIWQSAADRDDPAQEPLFEFASRFLQANVAA